MMKALVYESLHTVKVVTRAIPKLLADTDAIVKLQATTICGTDLHAIKGDVPSIQPGRILGHEGVGRVAEVGRGVARWKKGDAVVVSCITSCGACEACQNMMHSHCATGGWILGNKIDGTQAEYVRIPHADGSLHAVPPAFASDPRPLVMLSDILPTGFECGVLNGKVSPGSTVAIVGAGPVGLAALITAQLYSPSTTIVIDQDPNRLAAASKLGATHTITVDPSAQDNVTQEVMRLTEGKGCHTVIEAVGVPQTFALCQDLVGPGGVIANVGVHGAPVSLALDKLWDRNISITTRLVDATTTPQLLSLIKNGMLDPSPLITHNFSFDEMEKAYQTFGAAAKHNALKVMVTFPE